MPTIYFDNTNGSNTLSSGAGPATAVNYSTEGTTASYSGATITFSGATDLSGVAAGDVLYLATDSGAKFFTIATVTDGSDQVTLDGTPAGTSSGLNWAIGGTRASLAGSSSLYGATPDIDPVTIELVDGYAESVSSTLSMYLGTYGVIQGEDGAASIPTITLTSSAYIDLKSLGSIAQLFKMSGAASPAYGIRLTASYAKAKWLEVDVDAQYSVDMAASGSAVIGCDITNTRSAAIGIRCFQNGTIAYNRIDEADSGIYANGTLSGATIYRNVISNATNGIYINQTRTDAYGKFLANDNVLYDCVDGISIYGATNLGAMSGNIFASCTTYGINAGAEPDAELNSMADISNNAFHNNGTHRSGTFGNNNHDLTVDPFVSASTGNFNLNSTAGGGATLRAVTVTLP